jgi:hypothetical protein
MKYNLTQVTSQDNPFLGVMLEINSATGDLFIHSILLLVFVVAAYVIIRVTQDMGKSLLMSLHITTLLTLILYFMGLESGVYLVPDITMLTLIVVEAVSIAIIIYKRRANE